MENLQKKMLMEHPAYIAGQLSATHCLILALLDVTGADRREFAERALQRIDVDRTAFLNTKMPEPYEKALADEEAHLRFLFLD